MYDQKAHEKITEASFKSLPLRGLVRLGGKPYQADDPYVFVGAVCSEPVIEGLQSLCALKWDRLADVTMGIGGGFSYMGEVCGAVSGGIIAIGLDIAGRYRDTVAIRYLIAKYTQKLMKDCVKEFGCVRCRDLIGHDISGNLIPGDPAFAAYLSDMMSNREAGKELVCRRVLRWVLMYPLPSEQEELYPPIVS
jgi:C_GCAxxG_C_C family probable redox protein